MDVYSLKDVYHLRETGKCTQRCTNLRAISQVNRGDCKFFVVNFVKFLAVSHDFSPLKNKKELSAVRRMTILQPFMVKCLINLLQSNAILDLEVACNEPSHFHFASVFLRNTC